MCIDFSAYGGFAILLILVVRSETLLQLAYRLKAVRRGPKGLRLIHGGRQDNRSGLLRNDRSRRGEAGLRFLAQHRHVDRRLGAS